MGSDPKLGEPTDSAHSDRDDDELIRGALSAPPGDTRAFDELVRRHQGHIRANCRFIVEDPESSQDLAQEVFVKAYFGLASFEGRSSFRTWLRRIKVNQCLSFLESPRSRTEPEAPRIAAGRRSGPAGPFGCPGEGGVE